MKINWRVNMWMGGWVLLWMNHGGVNTSSNHMQFLNQTNLRWWQKLEKVRWGIAYPWWIHPWQPDQTAAQQCYVRQDPLKRLDKRDMRGVSGDSRSVGELWDIYKRTMSRFWLCLGYAMQWYGMVYSNDQYSPNWKFFTEAIVTRPLKLSTYAPTCSFHRGGLLIK